MLSYPFKTPDGRLKTPLVLLYWMPPTSSQETRMLYAGAVEEFREKAGVSKYVPLEKEIERVLLTLTDSSRSKMKMISKTSKNSCNR